MFIWFLEHHISCSKWEPCCGWSVSSCSWAIGLCDSPWLPDCQKVECPSYTRLSWCTYFASSVFWIYLCCHEFTCQINSPLFKTLQDICSSVYAITKQQLSHQLAVILVCQVIVLVFHSEQSLMSQCLVLYRALSVTWLCVSCLEHEDVFPVQSLFAFSWMCRRLKESFKPFNDAALHVPNKLKDSGRLSHHPHSNIMNLIMSCWWIWLASATEFLSEQKGYAIEFLSEQEGSYPFGSLIADTSLWVQKRRTQVAGCSTKSRSQLWDDLNKWLFESRHEAAICGHWLVINRFVLLSSLHHIIVTSDFIYLYQLWTWIAAGDTQIDKDEVDFLEDLYALLKAAHFRTLSLQEWQAACDNDFTVRSTTSKQLSSSDKSIAFAISESAFSNHVFAMLTFSD